MPSPQAKGGLRKPWLVLESKGPLMPSCVPADFCLHPQPSSFPYVPLLMRPLPWSPQTSELAR